jgi:hypothetical protein
MIITHLDALPFRLLQSLLEPLHRVLHIHTAFPTFDQVVHLDPDQDPTDPLGTHRIEPQVIRRGQDDTFPWVEQGVHEVIEERVDAVARDNVGGVDGKVRFQVPTSARISSSQSSESI